MKPEIKFESIIDRITDAFFILDRDGIISYASSSVSMLVGFTPAGLIGHSALEFIHVDHHKFAIENQEKLLAYPGSRITFDYRILTAHDSYRWMEFVFINMINIPQVGGIMAQMRDVSERKSTELLLEESQEQFRLFMGHIPAPAWIRDENGRYVYVNDSFCDLLGLNSDQMLGKKYAELFPELKDQIMDTDSLCRDYGKEIEYIMEAFDKNGMKKEFVIFKFPLVRLSGKTFIGAIGFDMGRIHEAKGIVQSAEDKFRLIFDHSPDPIFIEDEFGIILDANKKACELQGLGLESLIGLNILDLTPVHKRDTVASEFKKLWNQESNSVTSFAWSVNGDEIPVNIHAGKTKHAGRLALVLTLRKTLPLS